MSTRGRARGRGRGRVRGTTHRVYAPTPQERRALNDQKVAFADDSEEDEENLPPTQSYERDGNDSEYSDEGPEIEVDTAQLQRIPRPHRYATPQVASLYNDYPHRTMYNLPIPVSRYGYSGAQYDYPPVQDLNDDDVEDFDPHDDYPGYDQFY